MKTLQYILFSLLFSIVSFAAYSQSAGLDLELVSADGDSVVFNSKFYTPQGVSFRLEAIFITIAYDPSVMSTSAARGIMNHGFASANFDSYSDPLLDANGVYPDLSQYGEASKTIGQGIPYGQNLSYYACTFTFFPKSTNQGTTSFLVHGNSQSGGMSGYYIETSSLNQPFSPVTELNNITYPVELSAFTVYQQGKAAVLSWTTESEINNYGFSVQRRSPGEAWSTLEFVKGNGNAKERLQYIFTDQTIIRGGTYEYRLVQKDFDGRESPSPVRILEFIDEVNGFSLAQNYPNPMHATGSVPMIIRYSVSERSYVNLIVTDILGRHVATVVNLHREPGNYSASWQPAGLPAGTYIATISAQSEITGLVQRASTRMSIVK